MDIKRIPMPPPRPLRGVPRPSPLVDSPPSPTPGSTTTAANGSTGPRPEPVFPHARLIVQQWEDPVLDHLGHDPRSPYVERFWLAILGPTCLLLLRRFASELERHPTGFDVTCKDWAAELGLGMKGGKHGPFWRSVERACRFNAAQRNGERLAVRRRLPPLSGRQVTRLPEHLQEAHRLWVEEQQRRPRRKTVSVWTGTHGHDAA